MATFDVQHTHRIDFDRLLTELELTKYKNPEFYEYLADFARREREKIIQFTGMSDLPRVPSKDEQQGDV